MKIKKINKDTACQLLAKFFPKRLLYFCVIQVWAKMTSGPGYNDKGPDEYSLSDACKFLGFK